MAKKFEFRLDVVRDIRRRARDECARHVADRIRSAVAIRRRLDQFQGELRFTVEAAREDRTLPRLEAAALRMNQLYSHWLQGKTAQSAAELARAEADLAQERRKLTQATAKLKAIEKLRERRWRRHIVLVRREDQAITDEVAGRMIGASKGIGGVSS